MASTKTKRIRKHFLVYQFYDNRVVKKSEARLGDPEIVAHVLYILDLTIQYQNIKIVKQISFSQQKNAINSPITTDDGKTKIIDGHLHKEKTQFVSKDFNRAFTDSDVYHTPTLP